MAVIYLPLSGGPLGDVPEIETFEPTDTSGAGPAKPALQPMLLPATAPAPCNCREQASNAGERRHLQHCLGMASLLANVLLLLMVIYFAKRIFS